MMKYQPTIEEKVFLKYFEEKPRHTFRELVRYVKLMEKLTK